MLDSTSDSGNILTGNDFLSDTDKKNNALTLAQILQKQTIHDFELQKTLALKCIEVCLPSSTLGPKHLI